MRRIMSRLVLLASFLSTATTAFAAPIQPSSPTAGWLFDETYNGFGSTVKDSFGSMNGLTATGGTSVTTVAPGGPVTIEDDPFGVSGNTSYSTTANVSPASGAVWHTTFGQNAYRTRVSGASAVTVSAWLKYQEGALVTTGSASAQSFANAFMAFTLDSASANGGSAVYLNLPTNGTANANKNKLGVLGQSSATEGGVGWETIITTGTLIPGQWNHIVAILDFANDQIRTSINGNAFEIAAVDFNASVLTPGTAGGPPDIVPARSSSAEYTGLMDEVAFWNTALSIENVEWLRQNSLQNLVVVPEPTAVLLAVIGSLAVLGRRQRSSRRCPQE